MPTDRYTRCVLTLIAIALWGLLLRDVLPIRKATAADEAVPQVNLAQIAGVPLAPGVLDLQFKQPIRVEGGNDTPVLIIQTLNPQPGPKK